MPSIPSNRYDKAFFALGIIKKVTGEKRQCTHPLGIQGLNKKTKNSTIIIIIVVIIIVLIIVIVIVIIIVNIIIVTKQLVIQAGQDAQSIREKNCIEMFYV